MTQIRNRYADIHWYIISLILFIYLLLRAVYVPVLHDEVSTLYIYILSGNFLPWNAWPDANNHLLNSFLSWISYQSFGPSLWSLRFPNVLCSLLYFYSVIGISKYLRNKNLKVAFILIMFFTHGFIEFFAFARGYGMSMAFLFFALLCLFKWFDRLKAKYIFLLFLSLILAVLSNLTLLPATLLIVFYFFLTNLKNITVLLRFRNSIPLLLSLLLFSGVFIYLIRYSFFLKDSNLLYYGGRPDFLGAVIKTHMKMLFFTENSVILIGVLAFFCIVLVLFCYQLVRSRMQQFFNPSFVLFPLLFFGSLNVIILMNRLMNVNYPEDRTSLFLYPFFVGSIVFVTDSFGKKILQWILVPWIYVVLNFAVHCNLAFSFHWHYERIPPDFVSTVSRNSDGDFDSVTISGYKIHELIWSYYARFGEEEICLLNPHNYPNNLDDFILLRKEESDTMPGYLNDYSLIKRDPYSQIQLMKRKVPAARKFLFEREAVSQPIETEAEFLNFFPDTLFDFQGKSLLFLFDVRFVQGSDAGGSVFVVSVRDSLFNNLKYQRIETSWLPQKQQGHVKCALSVMNIPENADAVIAYIWNKDKSVLKPEHASVKVFEYVR
jgi:hypothetical protein